MSDTADLAPAASRGASALVHSSTPPKTMGTSLLDFPPDATFRVWRKPNGKDAVEPIDGGSVHVSELIPGDGDHVLVCFGSMNPSGWEVVRRELSVGDNLALHPILVSSVDKANIASGLWGAGDLAGLHGLTREPARGAVFVPSPTLMRLLKIDRATRTRNALVLIRNGHVVAEWISGGDDGNRPHDWTTILSMVN